MGFSFYSDRLQDRKLQHAIKKYAHTILHYSLQDRYKLHDLMGICRSLWYILPFCIIKCGIPHV